MRQCKEAVFEIFKDEGVPKESLIACVNSLFIWSCKEIYFKSRGEKR